MIRASDLIQTAPKYLGIPYSTMDCQRYVEKVLADCGLRKDLAGSNAWYRFLMQNGWVGTFEECRKKYGRIPPGAFLFILKQDGKEPEKYKPDGIGNASHIGLYTNLSGAEMVRIAREEYGVSASGCDFGNGAINSSYTHEKVCTSKFPGGWNRVGLWESRIDYGGGTMETPYQAKVVGGKLNLREKPQTSSTRLSQIPDGTILTVMDENEEWAKVDYNGMIGWVRKDFLEAVKESDTVTIPRKELEGVLDKLVTWLGGVG